MLAGGNTEGKTAPAACWEMQHFFLSPPLRPLHLHSFSAYFYFLMRVHMHTPYTYSMHSTRAHRHTHTDFLLSPISFIPVSFSPFSLISFFLSQPHTQIHSLIHSRLSPSLSFSLSLCLPPSLPAPAPLHPRSYLALICKGREDLTEEYVEMWFPSQVGNSGGR